MTDVVHPRWEAIDEEGQVQGTWHEKQGTYMTAEWIRHCRDEYFPGHRLRVTKMVPVTHWDGEAEAGILVIPPGLPYDPDFLRTQVITVVSTTGDHPDAASSHEGSAEPGAAP